MSRSPLGIVLAAGLGTRMRSQTPKVRRTPAGRPLLAWILGTLAEVGARPVVVLSKESEPARALLNGEATFAMQDPPRGTGDAVRVALESVKDARGEALIVYGDTPLVRAETLRALIALRAERSAVLAILSGEVGADNAYGRIVRNASGDVARIVEARLATTTEKALAESNLGAYAADLEWLRGAVRRPSSRRTSSSSAARCWRARRGSAPARGSVRTPSCATPPSVRTARPRCRCWRARRSRTTAALVRSVICGRARTSSAASRWGTTAR